MVAADEGALSFWPASSTVGVSEMSIGDGKRASSEVEQSDAGETAAWTTGVLASAEEAFDVVVVSVVVSEAVAVSTSIEGVCDFLWSTGEGGLGEIFAEGEECGVEEDEEEGAGAAVTAARTEGDDIFRPA